MHIANNACQFTHCKYWYFDVKLLHHIYQVCKSSMYVLEDQHYFLKVKR